jgi:hypothetical protein
MASDSVLQAVVEYARAQTVTGGSAAIAAFRDTASAEVGGTAVVPPFVVVREDGGRAERDFEGAIFGPSRLTLTATAKDASDARKMLDRILFAEANPNTRAGIEADGALSSYLTGHTGAAAHVTDLPSEGRAQRRGADIQYTVTCRIEVYAQRT